MMKKTAIIMCSLIILAGCGDTTYNMENGNVTNTDNSKNSKGQVVTDVESEVHVESNSNELVNSETLAYDKEEYQKLQNENDHLKEENGNLQNQIDDLNNKQNNIPVIEYKDLGLSIDGEDIPINKSNSMVIIDGKEYISKEIAEKLVLGNQNITIKDDTMFIGKVISEKANLFDQYVNDSILAKHINVANDAFGNTHLNVLYFNANPDQKIIYALNGKYSLLDFKAAPSDQGDINNHGKIIIKADGVPVYTSDDLTKETSPFAEKEIAINNCTLLTIEFDSEYFNDFLIYDAIVYN